ncbi:MAG: hypothetical protein M3036_02490, partial [Bifidobacteriales bacterium]|nr:hypothetical protein [Bifidobacteriales bacterium]
LALFPALKTPHGRTCLPISDALITWNRTYMFNSIHSRTNHSSLTYKQGPKVNIPEHWHRGASNKQRGFENFARDRPHLPEQEGIISTQARCR